MTTDTNGGTHQNEWKDDFAFFSCHSCLFVALWFEQFRSWQQDPLDERQEKNKLSLMKRINLGAKVKDTFS